MSTIELEVRDLVKRYAPKSIVGPLSFSVLRGEFVSLLGPSGCGKTTTLRCIAGFEIPSSGEILLSGERIDKRPPNRRDIGLVFQNYALFPHLTVYDNVAFGLRLRKARTGEIHDRVMSVLEMVGLPEVGGRYPGQLSGGQQQRVAIARSLILEPRVLLFDEPLSNLDYKLRVSMRSELRALQQRLGKTSIYVTHDQGEALALSDRVFVLSSGRIEQMGAPREVYERPRSEFVADFIGNSNLLRGEVAVNAAGRAILQSGCGLRLELDPSISVPSNAATALVRPEHIVVGVAADPSAKNVFNAEVTEATYLGQDLHLRLRISASTLFAVVQGHAMRHFGVGSRTNVMIPPRNVHVIPR